MGDCKKIVGDKIIRGDGPTAVSSRIGYFLSGPLHVESSYPPSNVMEVIATHVSETTDLTRFWDIESMGVSKGDCEDTDALLIYNSTRNRRKPFSHVGLHEDDRDVTRFLWLSDPTDPKSQLVTYRFRVVLFGATCSPFILNATLLKHKTLNASNPAANIITRDLYVDNVISSFQQEQDLLNYFRYARTLMSEAGFNLRSWTSNSSKLCELAVAEKVLDKDKVVKVLGMLWDPDNDEMSFVQRTIVNSERTTKRSILKQTSKLYDPLGLLSPVTVRAKLLVQDLWKKKFDWDTPLPVNIINTWADLSIDLNSVIQTKFQRPYFPTTENTANSADFNLHVFVDASARAYGDVAYLTSGHTSTLVFAKNRVAPVKEITLPRLELMAALIGARVTHHVSNAFYSRSHPHKCIHFEIY
ncbi:uncharacterized protein LOC132751365 [Ruditapes philippinarum]|uniref:uncharacterized protein LOC132751365 n=1 Tax=Ruditapes philippinarum TaxID=129788 RepID=UPI00295BF817|nr:uncharacterized protein LOC132751365 [Ruditapes philippinarum]